MRVPECSGDIPSFPCFTSWTAGASGRRSPRNEGAGSRPLLSEFRRVHNEWTICSRTPGDSVDRGLPDLTPGSIENGKVVGQERTECNTQRPDGRVLLREPPGIARPVGYPNLV